nr:MAG TPA: hypothetical protein [Caudoviricetes sp.]
MAKIRGYIDQVKITNDVIDKFKTLVDDIFPNISGETSSGKEKYICLGIDDRKLRIYNPTSGSSSTPNAIKMFNGNNSSPALYASDKYTSIIFGKCVIFETETGIVMTFGGYWNGNNTASIINVSYNKTTDILAISQAIDMYYIPDVNIVSQKNCMIHISKVNDSSIKQYPMSTTALYCPGFMNSPYPVVTEIVHDNEPTGIYALTQGQLMNATVSDGEKNIFISNVLGLED